jgi:hypothetical protein
MIRKSLREALTRIADLPALFITGISLGALFAVDILLQIGGNPVLGARIGFLGLCALPFFVGGSYGAIRSGEAGIHAYLRACARHYARVLLVGGVILSAALLTALLVTVTAMILGVPFQEGIPFTLLWVGIPFAFFTFFSDTAAVFEDRKVLDSIRRSVEFVIMNAKSVVFYYLANLAIGLAVLFFSVVIWSVTIADRLEPLVSGNQATLGNLTAGDLVNLVGIPGIWTGVAIGFFAVTVGGTYLISFKACYFQRAAMAAPALQVGEYDEKGRWYRF